MPRKILVFALHLQTLKQPLLLNLALFSLPSTYSSRPMQDPQVNKNSVYKNLNHTAQGPRAKIDSSNSSLLVITDFVIPVCSNRPYSPNPSSASAQVQRAPDNFTF
ncbi:hypothetical protein BGZ81_006392 [Podila clonocystis]|nr:hypothetical protein BGZ81_006392 [Podila clonocystis]